MLLAALIGWPFADRSESAMPQSLTVSLVSAPEIAGPEPAAPVAPSAAPDQLAAMPRPQSDATQTPVPDAPSPVQPLPSREAPELGPESPPTPIVDRVAPVPELPRPEEQVTNEDRETAAAPDAARAPEVEAPREEQVPEAAVREVRPQEQEVPSFTPEAAPPPRPETPARPEAPAQQEVASVPEPVPDPAPEPEPQPEPEETAPQVDDAIASALAEALAAEPDVAAPVPAGPPLTNGEREALRIAVGRCWNFSSLSTDAARVTVVVGMNMSADGKPQADSIHMISYEGGAETAARSAYETARRAILRCSGEGYPLPVEKYDHWREIEMTFNPERMRGR